LSDEPANDRIAEILNNGIIGIQDRMDTLNDTLKEIADSLGHIAVYFKNKQYEEFESH
jgi:hypothetical protein